MRYTLPLAALLIFGCSNEPIVETRDVCSKKALEKISEWATKCTSASSSTLAECYNIGIGQFCRDQLVAVTKDFAGWSIRKVHCADAIAPSDVAACAPFMKEATELTQISEPPQKEEEEEEREEECSGPKIEVSTQFEPLFWFGRYYFKGLWGYCL